MAGSGHGLKLEVIGFTSDSTGVRERKAHREVRPTGARTGITFSFNFDAACPHDRASLI